MTRLLKVSLLVSGCLALAACSTTTPRGKINYYSTGAAPPPLEIPPDLSRPRGDEALPAPRGGGTSYSSYSAGQAKPGAAGQQTVAIAGPAASGPGAARPMHIERAGMQRWLVVDGSPQELWGAVRGFFAKNGLAIVIEDKAAGILETDWAENRTGASEDFIQRYLSAVFPNLYDSGVRDKFRVRLEPGQKSGSTDIFLSHRRLEEQVNEGVFGRGGITWTSQPADPEIEAEMLRLLMVHLGAQDKEAETMLAAAGKERARIQKNDKGESVLRIDDDLDRAWRRVGLSLDRVGFTVEDRDRTLGVYYVRYVDPAASDKKKGLLARLIGDDEPLDTRFQVKLAAAGSGTTDVGVRDSAGAVVTSATGDRMLNLLYEQLK